jgi:arsenate reductase
MTAPAPISLPRRLLAEFLGTALLVTAIVGSGIMATTLSPADVGLQLLENSVATAFALGALILTFGPISGAHFNPVVSAADWFLGRRSRTGLPSADLAGYVVAQISGAIAGCVLANLMFDLTPATFAAKDRTGGHLWLGEVVATAGLLLLIFALARSGRAAVAPAAVGAYIGAAYWFTSSTSWFTSSTSFANPAVTIGRAFTDTFAHLRRHRARLGARLHHRPDDRADHRHRPAARPLPDRRRDRRRGRGRAPGRRTDAHSLTPHRPALQGNKVMSDIKPTVLFVCVHNAGRSQMAAGWLRHLAGDTVEVRSAGSEPADQINPAAVDAMREVGIDITGQTPTKLTSDAAEESDVIITMGCGDACPVFPGKRYEDWKLDDPAGQGIDTVRPIRDAIRTRIEKLLTDLNIPA